MRRLTLICVAVISLTALAATCLLYWELEDYRAELDRLEPHLIDIRFSQFMSLHHQQAIAMAQLLQDGKPTGLAVLARSIASAQLVELGEMQGWLWLWDQPLLPRSDDMTWMLLGSNPYDADLMQYLVDCGRSATGMPGLATPEQMNQLRQLEGRPRDEFFLQLMLAHHEGGLPMARFAAREASLPAVRALAGRIVLNQSKEINQMQSMLALAAAHPHNAAPTEGDTDRRSL